MNNNPENSMKLENRKYVNSLFIRSVIAIVLNLVVYIVVTGIFYNLSTKEIGEVTLQKGDDGKYFVVSTTYYSDATDGENETTTTTTTTAQTNSTSGVETTSVTSTNPDVQVESFRSEMPEDARRTGEIVAQIVMLLVVINLMYTSSWYYGDRRANKVDFKHAEYDKFFGFKMGLIAAIPQAVAYIILLISRLSGGAFLPKFLFAYRFINMSFAPIMNLFGGYASSYTADISVLGMILLFLSLFVYALAAHLGFTLGYKRIVLKNKLIYKKQK